MSSFVDAYSDLLITQYKNKPKAKAHIEALISGYEDIYNTINSFFKVLDVDIAVGKQLDIIGKILGISRETDFPTKRRYFGFANNKNSYQFNNNNLTMYPFYKGESLKESGTLDDITFRVFIKAKIIKNNVKATMIDEDKKLSLQDVADFLFNSKAYIIDNYNMSVGVYIDNTYDTNLLQYLKNAKLIPKPQGVGIRSIVSYKDGNTFGFRDINPNAKGFNDGNNGVEFANTITLT